MQASIGAGIGKALILEAGPAADSASRLTESWFTPAEVLSSLWEAMVWVTSNTGVQGSHMAVDRFERGSKTYLEDVPWASELLASFTGALRFDAGKRNDSVYKFPPRPSQSRNIFATWLVIQKNVHGHPVPHVGFEGPRGQFGVAVVDEVEGMLDGARAAAVATAQSCADISGAPLELVLGTVDEAVYERAARGDFA